jgi:hypothetical protein
MTVDLSRTLGLTVRELLPSTARVVFMAALTLAFWYGLSSLWPAVAESSLTSAFVRLAVLGVAGTAFYAGLAWLFRAPELRRVKESIAGKLRS